MATSITQLELLIDEEDQVGLLRNSPIHGVRPVDLREIDVSCLDEDETNPGSDQHSRRYERRAPDIRESFDIIGGIVYPLVVCENTETPGRYVIVDGHGRSHEARRRGVDKIRALIFPPLTLEQRICLREVLNAAQEPFDTPLVLKDLHLLAHERSLDIRNENDLRSLLADFPTSIRKQEAKLKILAKWPAEISDRIGIEDNDDAGVVGFDKIKELTSFVNAVRKNHPEVSEIFEGDELFHRALKLYFEGAFRGGRRSQDTIREVRGIISKLPQNHQLVTKFVKGVVDFPDFKLASISAVPHRGDAPSITALCKDLSALLTDIDSNTLTAAERRSLQRTADMASQVLAEVDE